MSDVMEQYRAKLIAADDAAAMVKSNTIVDYYAFVASSRYLDAALAKRVGEVENVMIRSELRLAPPFQVLVADPERRSFAMESLFYGPLELFVPTAQRTPIPARLSNYEKLLIDGDMRADYCAFQVSPPDADGFLYFCPSPALAKTLVRKSGVSFAEINETFFPIRGSEDRRVHISEIDYIIEGDSPPMVEVPNPAPSDVETKIAEVILRELADRDCLQVGYGSLPMAAIEVIAKSDLKDLGIHTEVLPEGIVNLYNAGKITGAHKGVDKGKIVASIVIGGRPLYDFIRDCPDVYLASSTYTNDPNVMRQHDNFVSVNACLEVDLGGQINAESIGWNTISGTGGNIDFVMAAQLSKNGKAILCCPSTYMDKEGNHRSRIVATMTPGSIVTTPRSCVQYIATENGIVNLRGKNLWKRAELLVSIAHPDFQDDLVKQAEKIGLWRKGSKSDRAVATVS